MGLENGETPSASPEDRRPVRPLSSFSWTEKMQLVQAVLMRHLKSRSLEAGGTGGFVRFDILKYGT